MSRIKTTGESNTMKNKTLLLEKPTLPAISVIDQLNGYLDKIGMPPVRWHDLAYFAWPETFPNASGPFPGIGGQAFTKFRMEAWAFDQWAVIFCDGRVVKAGELMLQASYRCEPSLHGGG